MGKSYTPTFRVEIVENKQIMQSCSSWDSKYAGRPTNANLVKWVDAYVTSLKIGGVNAHISESLGYMPIPDQVRVVRQSTGVVVASWKAPMFYAF